jgi:hypothetical protein
MTLPTAKPARSSTAHNGELSSASPSFFGREGAEQRTDLFDGAAQVLISERVALANQRECIRLFFALPGECCDDGRLQDLLLIHGFHYVGLCVVPP